VVGDRRLMHLPGLRQGREVGDRQGRQREINLRNTGESCMLIRRTIWQQVSGMGILYSYLIGKESPGDHGVADEVGAAGW